MPSVGGESGECRPKTPADGPTTARFKGVGARVMIEHLEQQKKFTINQWKIFAAATIGDMLDFFDFLLIAFVLAFIVKDWNLTYGQSAAILLASGVSAPLGSLIWGWVADRIGRRKVMIAIGARLGLVPRQYSTGGRSILGRISKRGSRYLRMLLAQAARVLLTSAHLVAV